jgi:hypothetical protein
MFSRDNPYIKQSLLFMYENYVQMLKILKIWQKLSFHYVIKKKLFCQCHEHNERKKNSKLNLTTAKIQLNPTLHGGTSETHLF